MFGTTLVKPYSQVRPVYFLQSPNFCTIIQWTTAWIKDLRTKTKLKPKTLQNTSNQYLNKRDSSPSGVKLLPDKRLKTRHVQLTVKRKRIHCLIRAYWWAHLAHLCARFCYRFCRIGCVCDAAYHVLNHALDLDGRGPSYNPFRLKRVWLMLYLSITWKGIHASMNELSHCCVISDV